MIFADSSALIAIIAGEPEADRLADGSSPGAGIHVFLAANETIYVRKPWIFAAIEIATESAQNCGLLLGIW
jgi:hypothetical protein